MRRKRSACFFRHRWSGWGYVKRDYADGYEPEVDKDLLFRMCRNCGHQEVRERVKT